MFASLKHPVPDNPLKQIFLFGFIFLRMRVDRPRVPHHGAGDPLQDAEDHRLGGTCAGVTDCR